MCMHGQIVVLTTDLMLAGEDFEREAARFFSETCKALGDKVCLSQQLSFYFNLDHLTASY